MLLELTIQNLALIDDLTISFGEGFNILTGETGAGKSIVVDAVNLVLGERADRDLISIGADRARIQALFDVSDNQPVMDVLRQFEIETEDDLLIISRELTTAGKNICRICGHIVPLSTLKQISSLLLDIHGQHEHQSLMDDKRHLSFLDNFAGKTIEEDLLRVKESYHAYRAIQSELNKLKTDASERERRIDMLSFQFQELKGAELQKDEEVQLERQRELFRNAQKITDNLVDAYASLYDGGDSGDSTLESLRRGADAMNAISTIDEAYEKLYTRLQDLYYQLEDASMEIRDLKDQFEFDQQESDRVDERLDLIHRLRRKYGPTTKDMLLYQADIEKELLRIEDSDALIEELSRKVKRQQETLFNASIQLHEKRKEAAGRFEKEIEIQLRDLGMKNAQFKVVFDPLPDKVSTAARFSVSGMDQVAFFMTANLGQPLKPLSHVASGGELSRIMLALKNISAQHLGIPSMVFDEIDTGISGRMAQVVAEKMTEIAARHQVICVTHLPQIAAMADSHFHVKKYDSDGRTRTIVVKLDTAARTEEIARMIGGAQENSESSLKHARTMLVQAAERKSELRDIKS